jgi:hypothetical protein
MGVLRLGQAGDERTGVGKNKQPFTVMVEPPGGVNARDIDVVG